MRHLELKIPPPVVALIVALMMWTVADKGPQLTLTPPLTESLFWSLVVVGIIFDLSGLLKFLSRHTTINPWTPQKSSALVTTGIYRVTRNPMYVGLFILLMAWGIHLGTLIGLIGPFVYGLFIHYFQIMPEEKILTALFGDEYIRYTRQVRRWI